MTPKSAKEPTATPDQHPGPHPDPHDDDALAALGISRTTVDQYHVGPFRYSSLTDALAQARRPAPTTP